MPKATLRHPERKQEKLPPKVDSKSESAPPAVRVEEDPDTLISRLFPPTNIPKTAKLSLETVASATPTDKTSRTTDQLVIPDEARASDSPAELWLPALAEEMEREAALPQSTGQGARRNLMHGLLVVGHLLLLNSLSIPVTAYIMRQLGATGIGQLSAATTLVTLCGLFTSLGLRPIFVRRVSQSPETVQQDLAEQLGLRLVLTIAAACAAIGYTFIVGYPWIVKQCVFLAVLSLVMTACGNVLADVLQGMHRMKTYSAINFVAGGVLTAVQLYAAYNNCNPLSISMAFLTGPAIFMSLLWITIRTEHFPIRPRFQIRRFGELLKESSNVGVYQLSVAFRDRLEHLMLPKLTGLTSFGYYSAGTMAADRLFIVPEGFVTAFYPTIARSHTEEPEAVVPHVAHLLVTSLVACAPMALLVSFLSEPIARILFRTDPDLCQTIISITIWAVVLRGIQMPMGCALQATGHHDVAARNGVLATILSLVATICLLLKFKMVGAFWLWPVRAAISVAFLLAPFHRYFPGVWRQVPIFRIGLSVALLIVVLLGSHEIFENPVRAYVFGALSGLIAYFSSMMILGVVRITDVKLLLKRH